MSIPNKSQGASKTSGKIIALSILIGCLAIGGIIATVAGIKHHHELQQLAAQKAAAHKYTSAAPQGVPDPSWQDNELCMAVYNNDFDKLKQLLDANPDALNRGFGTMRWTLLHLTARYGRPEMAAELLRRGADINARTTEGHTPLYDAIERSHIMMVTLLLQNDADASIPDVNGQTPLQMAIAKHHTGSTTLLQKHGVTK